jgi:histidinol-phosphate aminotransferase
MAIEFGEKTRRIPVYPVAGGYDLGADVAMLASNEAPFGPAETVIAAAARTLAGANRYPDPSYRPLREALASRYGLEPQNIALGNGSCELLLARGASRPRRDGCRDHRRDPADPHLQPE